MIHAPTISEISSFKSIQLPATVSFSSRSKPLAVDGSFADESCNKPPAGQGSFNEPPADDDGTSDNEPFIPPADDDDSSVSESDNLFNTGKWNDYEVKRLEEAYRRHGNDSMAVSSYVGTRSNEQCRSKVKKTPTESDNLFNTRKWNKNEVERLEEAY
jgi:hypothetical protein